MPYPKCVPYSLLLHFPNFRFVLCQDFRVFKNALSTQTSYKPITFKILDILFDHNYNKLVI